MPPDDLRRLREVLALADDLAHALMGDVQDGEVGDRR
jgi:hypothetical protein